MNPFDRGERPPVSDLKRGDRIQVLGRKGTFDGYWDIKNLPKIIHWLPDGTLEFEVSPWTSYGIKLDPNNDPDHLTDFDAWESENK